MSRRAIVDWVVPMAALALGVLAASVFVVTPRAIIGRSMEPALYHGDLVLVDRWTFRHRDPRDGEVVLFSGPEGRPMVKRVQGRIAQREVRVLGDNPSQSIDSRHFGPVGTDRMRGRVLWRYWPLSRAGRVPPGR